MLACPASGFQEKKQEQVKYFGAPKHSKLEENGFYQKKKEFKAFTIFKMTKELWAA